MFAGDYHIHRTGMVVVLGLAMFWEMVPAPASEADAIQPYSENPFYWQYGAVPVEGVDLIGILPVTGELLMVHFKDGAHRLQGKGHRVQRASGTVSTSLRLPLCS